MNARTIIIAEAGVNHNGDLEIAKSLIDVASSSGADYVKFQTFSADRLVTHSAEKANYQKKNSKSDESQFEMLKRLELSREMHVQLIQHCSRRNIAFLSTGFDEESVDLLVELGQELIKIPSGEITNLPFLRHVGSLGFPVIMSTGMSTLQEIGEALSVLENHGTPRDRTTVLHCTSEYPTALGDVNLRALQAIAREFQVKVGYSDHTLGIEVSIAAVALGARVIEKHFTLDRSFDGPDHKASLEPNELSELVSSIRNIEIAIGSGRKEPTPSELINLEVCRKSIMARHEIRAGEIFTESNIVAKRPGGGLSPMKWNEVIGTQSNRDYQSDEMIDL